MFARGDLRYFDLLFFVFWKPQFARLVAHARDEEPPLLDGFRRSENRLDLWTHLAFEEG